MVLSFDAKGVATIHRDPREATRKGEKPNRKRMAHVATAYTLEPWPRAIADVLHGVHDQDDKAVRRPRPTNKARVGEHRAHPQHVIDDAFAEALRRDPERERRRRWVVRVDGNKDQLARIKGAARIAGVEITLVLDLVHALEYLWRAAYAFYAAGTEEVEKWARARLLALLNGRSATPTGSCPTRCRPIAPS
jgi:hypothetical protein